jgi:tRNA A-37 threonylcarbamoyl transferase component Bud32
MDAERYARVRELFLAIEELPPEQQQSYLQAACADDPELFDEVVSLLAEHNRESALFEGGAAVRPTVPHRAAEQDTAAQETDRGASGSQDAFAAAIPFLPSAVGSERPDSSVEKADSAARAREEIKRRKSLAAAADSSKRGDRERRSQVTRQGVQRTHAAPRYRGERAGKRQRHPPPGLWRSHARRHRRVNSGWLWLAAVLPTALVGIGTYLKVSESLRQANAAELAAVADSVRAGVDRFLNDQARLTESWSRQVGLRDAIVALLETAAQDETGELLRDSPHAQSIHDQMVAVSKRADIKYVVWDRTGRIIASWLDGGTDVGSQVSPEGAGNLARAMRGETVLFGPQILRADTTGFQPETDQPVMAEIMPIYDQRGKVVATMLIRGLGMYADFDQIFRQAAEAGGVDVYAVDRAGVMLTNSANANRGLDQSAPDSNSVACRLRVSDPGAATSGGMKLDPAVRRTQQLTYAAAGASSGRAGSRLQPYRNYAGVPVVGAWRWVDRWGLGIIVERSADSAFATARIVRYGFFSLGLVLTLTALTAAAGIARRTAIAQAAVHPLSRYELISELGSGGMGVVYRARHTQLGRDTALKVLRGDRDNIEDRLRFDREAKLAASLSNPHTVTIYDYGRGDRDEAYCVMEFLKGITLYDVVARSGYQPIGRVLFILRQICDSLGEAHSLGLVHRDIKPQNIMLSLDPSVGDWAVVFDFGLAKPLQPDVDSYQTAETIWAGTPMYMAPERYRDPNTIDPRSDLYSVGCIAYFLLSGRPPFIECDPESLFALVLTEQPIGIDVHRDGPIPPEIDQLVKRCMAKHPDDRFGTVDALARELDVLIATFPWTVEEARAWWRVHGAELT